VRVHVSGINTDDLRSGRVGSIPPSHTRLSSPSHATFQVISQPRTRRSYEERTIQWVTDYRVVIVGLGSIARSWAPVILVGPDLQIAVW